MTTEYTIEFINVGTTSDGRWFKAIHHTTDNKTLYIEYYDMFDNNTYKVYCGSNPHRRTYLGDKVEFLDNNTKIRITDTAELARIEEINRMFAIRRIERNPIYQLGLGDKLRRKEHEKMF